MKNIVRNVELLSSIIRELEKNNSKLENGHFVFARDKNVSLINKLKDMQVLVLDHIKEVENVVDEVGFIDKLVRELEKINSKIENGNIIYAWRDNRRLLSDIQTAKSRVIQIQKEEVVEK